MIKGSGDPFLLHQGPQPSKIARKAGEPPIRPVKRPKGTFRDPKVLEMIDRK